MQRGIIRDHCSGGDIAMSAEKFSGGVNDDVSAERQWLLHDRRHHRVINSKQRVNFARDLRNTPDVADTQ